MKYTFPVIHKIADILPAIENRKEFSLHKGDSYISVDYNYVEPTTFNEIIRRECRGIKFDRNSGFLIGRPFHKFFNLNERDETQEHVIPWSNDHIVYEKLDGSLIHPVLLNNEVVYMTRAGVTDVSKLASLYIKQHHEIDEWCRKVIRKGFTPLFEYCSPKNRIVIKYNEENLHLLTYRHLYEGYYTNDVGIDPPDIIQKVNMYGNNLKDISNFISHTRGLIDQEGYVIHFNNGHMIKIKADEYVAKHKTKDSFDREKNVLEFVLNNKEDDLIPFLDTDQKAKLVEYASLVRKSIDFNVDFINGFVAKAKGICNNDRKRFALEFVTSINPKLKGVLFEVFNGRDARESLLKMLHKNLGSQTKVDEIKEFIGNPKW